MLAPPTRVVKAMMASAVAVGRNSLLTNTMALMAALSSMKRHHPAISLMVDIITLGVKQGVLPTQQAGEGHVGAA